MKEQDLKAIIKEVVRECIKEACDGGKLAGGEKGKRMFKHIKKGYKGEKDSEDAKRIAAATVNKQLGEDGVDKTAAPSNGGVEEAGAISEYDESEEIKLIRGLHLITKKLLGMHKGMDVDKHKEEDHEHIDENGPQYKVRDGRSYVEQTGKVNRAREIQEDPVINEDEGQYKVRDGKSQVEQPGKVNRAREIQKNPKVNEASHKVQARSYKTVKDVDQDPKNPADPEVPMSEALTEAKKLLAKIKASRKK